jgi:hypothetical protein
MRYFVILVQFHFDDPNTITVSTQNWLADLSAIENIDCGVINTTGQSSKGAAITDRLESNHITISLVRFEHSHTYSCHVLEHLTCRQLKGWDQVSGVGLWHLPREGIDKTISIILEPRYFFFENCPPIHSEIE